MNTNRKSYETLKAQKKDRFFINLKEYGCCFGTPFEFAHTSLTLTEDRVVYSYLKEVNFKNRPNTTYSYSPNGAAYEEYGKGEAEYQRDIARIKELLPIAKALWPHSPSVCDWIPPQIFARVGNKRYKFGFMLSDTDGDPVNELYDLIRKYIPPMGAEECKKKVDLSDMF